MAGSWLVFFDLDGTLWDHLDVSATNPPFNRISDNVISDRNDVRITLLQGSAEFVRWVKKEGGIISTCSWNEYDKAMSALNAFGLTDLFDFQKISTNPNKYILMEEVLQELGHMSIAVQQGNLFYLDDRDIHMSDIRRRFPELTFFHMWKDKMDFEKVKKVISSKVIELL